MRSAGLLLVVLMSGCLRDNLVDCGNGVACPAGTACATVSAGGADGNVCVDPGAFAPCEGLDDLAPCALALADGTCHGGACLPNECGNGRVDANEICDDGNTVAGDGCSFGCGSDERCGNGVIDPLILEVTAVVPNEQCDDAGLLSHDACSSGCQSEALRWEPLTIAVPEGKHSHALAYDSTRDRIVLFGGAGTGSFGVPLPRGDTWESDGVSWTKITTRIAPPARFGHSMAYDPVRRRTVLFGGSSAGTLFDDTWEWDGTNWKRLSPATSPPARRNAASAYDSVRGRWVVFGGDNELGGVAGLGDTWEWDGVAWTERAFATGPLPRFGARMAFDPTRGVSILAGGNTPSRSLDDTWEYNGVAWTLRPALLPFPGSLNGMAFDGTAMIALGTSPTPAVATNTFRYDGTTWTRQLPVGAAEPTRRVKSSMVYDPRRARVVLFGGFFSDSMCPGGCSASLGDLWVWNRTQWAQVSVTAPTTRTHHASAYDDDRRCVVMFGGGGTATQVITPAETWELCGEHWVPGLGTQPTARVSAAMAYDRVRKRTVLFGGRNASGSLLGDTQLWNGSTWSPVPTAGPGPRTGHAMAFDPVRGNVVMFGGQSNPGLLGDTWVWDGSQWTEQNLAIDPPPRANHSLTFDPVRGTLVLLGGDNAVGTFADQWEWNGVAWTQLSSSSLPPARSTSSVAWNAPRKRLVQFGGAAQFSLFEDVWEASGPGWSQQFASDGPLPRYGHSLTPVHDGVLMFGGYTGTIAANDLWRLRWDDDATNEACTLVVDLDGDGLAGCADPDCWHVCSPRCPPGVPCPAPAPRCGDGVCNSAIETCRMCPGDCGACLAACGDNMCDGPETAASCPGDCP